MSSGGEPADTEVGLGDYFNIVGDGGGDFCEIPSMTCETVTADGGTYVCTRDDDGSFQGQCEMDTSFGYKNCDNIDGTSGVTPFLNCVGPACG